MGKTERWLGPVSGLVGSVLLIVGSSMTSITALDGVDLDATPAGVARVVAENEGRLAMGTSLLSLGVFFLLWFFIWLKTRLDTGAGLGWASAVASMSGVALLVLFALGGAYVRSLLQTELVPGEDVVAKAAVLYDWDYWSTFAPFAAAHLIGAGVAIAKGAARPRFIGWVAVGIAALSLALSPGLMGFVFMFWTLGLSVLLLFQGRPAPSPGTEDAAAPSQAR